MAKLIRTTAARLFEEAHTCLSILGVVLLALSVAAVPTSEVLADSGSGGGSILRAKCAIIDNSCNDGCAFEKSKNNCNYTSGSTGCTAKAGCSNCTCSLCREPGTMDVYCDCMCFGNFTTCYDPGTGYKCNY